MVVLLPSSSGDYDLCVMGLLVDGNTTYLCLRSTRDDNPVETTANIDRRLITFLD